MCSQREQSTGTIVTATKSDIASENITTNESCANRMLEMPDRNSSGMNTAMCVSVGGEDRGPDLLAAVDGGGHPVLAHVQVPVRVLEHHDRGVDDHADAEGEAAERHRVQREAAEVEQRERADDRHRNRRADDQRRAEVAQEREDDQHDEDAAEQRVLLHVVDRALDEDATGRW